MTALPEEWRKPLINSFGSLHCFWPSCKRQKKFVEIEIIGFGDRGAFQRPCGPSAFLRDPSSLCALLRRTQSDAILVVIINKNYCTILVHNDSHLSRFRTRALSQKYPAHRKLCELLANITTSPALSLVTNTPHNLLASLPHKHHPTFQKLCHLTQRQRLANTQHRRHLHFYSAFLLRHRSDCRSTNAQEVAPTNLCAILYILREHICIKCSHLWHVPSQSNRLGIL